MHSSDTFAMGHPKRVTQRLQQLISDERTQRRVRPNALSESVVSWRVRTGGNLFAQRISKAPTGGQMRTHESYLGGSRSKFVIATNRPSSALAALEQRRADDVRGDMGEHCEARLRPSRRTLRWQEPRSLHPQATFVCGIRRSRRSPPIGNARRNLRPSVLP